MQKLVPNIGLESLQDGVASGIGQEFVQRFFFNSVNTEIIFVMKNKF